MTARPTWSGTTRSTGRDRGLVHERRDAYRRRGPVLPSGDWHETQLADFDGDGKTDIIWRNAITGATAIWLMNGGAIVAGGGLHTDPNWEVTHVGDLNGDGKADLIWRHINGTTAVWLMNGIAGHR